MEMGTQSVSRPRVRFTFLMILEYLLLYKGHSFLQPYQYHGKRYFGFPFISTIRSVSTERRILKQKSDDALFFASSISNQTQISRGGEVPFQFYLMTHDPRSCTVTAEQYACQMVQLANIVNVEEYDVSIPYDAAARFYYEVSDKSMEFDVFKRQYIANAIASVKAKQNSKLLAIHEQVESQTTSTTKSLPAIHDDVPREVSARSLPFAKAISEFILKPQSELIDIGLVLMSSFIVALGTLPANTLPDIVFSVCNQVEQVLSLFFCFGFFLRWYSVGNLSPMYFTKPLPFIDFFASVLPLVLMKSMSMFGSSVEAVPSWLMTNSALVNLRLLRLLRIQELLVDIETFTRVGEILGLRDVKPYQLKLTRVLITIFTLCSVSTGLIYTAEYQVNTAIPDYFTALYFGLTTLTTVGFGDITPVTLPGRLVVMGSILVGVAIIPAQAAELVEALIDFQAERRQKKLIKNRLRTRADGGTFESDPMVDPRISCSSCGKRQHRSDAFYCWNCGSKLWQ
jgi:Ion channel.